MPQVVACQCGQRFAARDDLAGKTVKCPRCSEPLTIPGGSAPAPAATAPAATAPAAKGAPLVVACQCGQRFAARPDLAGKRVKCPQCGMPLEVPAAPTVAAAKGAPAARQTTSPPAKKSAPPPAPQSNLVDLLDDLGVQASKTGQRCASCQKDMPPGAVICVQCGYNHETGQKLETRRWT